MRPALLVLVALSSALLGGCFSRKPLAVSQGEAVKILEKEGWRSHGNAKGIESDWKWQHPNNFPSVLTFGASFTRHRIENGELRSETYGWALIPGLFGILPGFLVNVPLPLEDRTVIDITTKPAN